MAMETSVSTAMQAGVAIGLFAVVPLLRRAIFHLRVPMIDDALPSVDTTLDGSAGRRN